MQQQDQGQTRGMRSAGEEAVRAAQEEEGKEVNASSREPGSGVSRDRGCAARRGQATRQGTHTYLLVEERSNAGGKLVVADAIDESAASFYRAHNFQPSPADPHRLVMKLSTAARVLELSWP